MKKLLALLLLAAPCFANGPKYVGSSTEPSEYQEFLNVYHDIANPTINIGTASTMTVTQLNVSTIAVTGQIDMRSKKIINLSNGTASTDAVAFGQLFLLSAPIFSSSSVKTAAATTTYTAAGPIGTIVPKSASSRVVVCVTGDYSNTNVAASNGQLTVFRNSTDLDPTGNGMFRDGGGSATSNDIQIGICLIDSPAVTTSTTYQVYIKRQQGTATITYPQDTGAKTTLATIILFEVP